MSYSDINAVPQLDAFECFDLLARSYYAITKKTFCFGEKVLLHGVLDHIKATKVAGGKSPPLFANSLWTKDALKSLETSDDEVDEEHNRCIAKLQKATGVKVKSDDKFPPAVVRLNDNKRYVRPVLVDAERVKNGGVPRILLGEDHVVALKPVPEGTVLGLYSGLATSFVDLNKALSRLITEELYDPPNKHPHRHLMCTWFFIRLYHASVNQKAGSMRGFEPFEESSVPLLSPEGLEIANLQREAGETGRSLEHRQWERLRRVRGIDLFNLPDLVKQHCPEWSSLKNMILEVVLFQIGRYAQTVNDDVSIYSLSTGNSLSLMNDAQGFTDRKTGASLSANVTSLTPIWGYFIPVCVMYTCSKVPEGEHLLYNYGVDSFWRTTKNHVDDCREQVRCWREDQQNLITMGAMWSRAALAVAASAQALIGQKVNGYVDQKTNGCVHKTNGCVEINGNGCVPGVSEPPGKRARLEQDSGAIDDAERLARMQADRSARVLKHMARHASAPARPLSRGERASCAAAASTSESRDVKADAKAETSGPPAEPSTPTEPEPQPAAAAAEDAGRGPGATENSGSQPARSSERSGVHATPANGEAHAGPACAPLKREHQQAPARSREAPGGCGGGEAHAGQARVALQRKRELKPAPSGQQSGACGSRQAQAGPASVLRKREPEPLPSSEGSGTCAAGKAQADRPNESQKHESEPEPARSCGGIGAGAASDEQPKVATSASLKRKRATEPCAAGDARAGAASASLERDRGQPSEKSGSCAVQRAQAAAASAAMNREQQPKPAPSGERSAKRKAGEVQAQAASASLMSNRQPGPAPSAEQSGACKHTQGDAPAGTTAARSMDDQRAQPEHSRQRSGQRVLLEARAGAATPPPERERDAPPEHTQSGPPNSAGRPVIHINEALLTSNPPELRTAMLWYCPTPQGTALSFVGMGWVALYNGVSGQIAAGQPIQDLSASFKLRQQSGAISTQTSLEDPEGRIELAGTTSHVRQLLRKLRELAESADRDPDSLLLKSGWSAQTAVSNSDQHSQAERDTRGAPGAATNQQRGGRASVFIDLTLDDE